MRFGHTDKKHKCTSHSLARKKSPISGSWSSHSRHAIELLESGYRVRLSIELFPCTDLLEDVREHMPGVTVLRSKPLAHSQQITSLLDEVLKVLVVAFVRQMR
mmetsp:Transcript_17288/g.43440  ORF Transcript_17288/g.43440 Transcript_17288/m.43440 type:complete len:103 (+) Transcript_17288:463-771(+)